MKFQTLFSLFSIVSDLRDFCAVYGVNLLHKVPLDDPVFNGIGSADGVSVVAEDVSPGGPVGELLVVAHRPRVPESK